MFTRNSIIREIKDMPADRLEEIYQFVHAINRKGKGSEASRKKILSYAGAFLDMNDKDYKSLIAEVKKARNALFKRKVKL